MGEIISALCMIVQAVSTSRGLVNVRDEVDPCEAEVLAGMTDLERQASSLTEPAVLVASLTNRIQIHLMLLEGLLSGLQSTVGGIWGRHQGYGQGLPLQHGGGAVVHTAVSAAGVWVADVRSNVAVAWRLTWVVVCPREGPSSHKASLGRAGPHAGICSQG